MIATAANHGHRSLRARDLARREGTDLQSPDDRLSGDDILIEGEIAHRQLRHGISLHWGDVAEERPFTVTSSLAEGLSCIFFLEGRVDLTLGDRSFVFTGRPGAGLQGAAIMTAHRESFRRTSAGPQRVRHLVVSVTPEWLEAGGVDRMAEQRMRRLLEDHLRDHRWDATKRIDEAVRQVMAPCPFAPELRDLYLEGRAVEIVAETLSVILESDVRGASSLPAITPRDRACLKRAEEFIAFHLTSLFSVEDVAREAGMSASGLQRLFKTARNASIFEYVRRQRLHLAHDVLSRGEATIQTASLLAGYRHAPNFSTAYKREFGVAPSNRAPNRVSKATRT